MTMNVMFTAATMTAETLKEFDRKIEQQLRSLDAGAVEMWTKANAARDAENHEEAAMLYAAVYQRVPAFVHALRRQAGEEAELGYRERSIEHARAAVAVERSSENVAMLALALATVKNGVPDTKDMTEARALASQAERLGPDDSFPLQVQAEIAVAANDLEALRTVAEKLERVAPRDPGTHLLLMSVAASDGSWGEARQALARARSVGLPEKDELEMLVRLAGSVAYDTRGFRAAWSYFLPAHRVSSADISPPRSRTRVIRSFSDCTTRRHPCCTAASSPSTISGMSMHPRGAQGCRAWMS
jgi:hypothetical protein